MPIDKKQNVVDPKTFSSATGMGHKYLYDKWLSRYWLKKAEIGGTFFLGEKIAYVREILRFFVT